MHLNIHHYNSVISTNMLLLGLLLAVVAASVKATIHVPLTPTNVTSSTEQASFPSYAFDGDYNTNFAGNSVFASSDSDLHPYLTMDFGSSKVFYQVTMTNRGDCCDERMRDLLIVVYVNDPNENNGIDPIFCTFLGQPSVAASGNITVVCKDKPVGRYMRIFQESGLVLQLVEVVVEGEDAPACPCNFPVITGSPDVCLYVSDVKGSYAEAAEYCDILGGELYEMRDAAEQTLVTAELESQIFDRIDGSSSSSNSGSNSGSSSSSDWRLERRHYWFGITQLFDGSIWRYLSNGQEIPTDPLNSALVNGECHTSNLTANVAELCGLQYQQQDRTYMVNFDNCEDDHYFICSRPQGSTLANMTVL